MQKTDAKSCSRKTNRDVKMDNELYKLARKYLKNLYELTIKFPDHLADYEKTASIVGVDTSTAQRIVEYLQDNKLITIDGNSIAITINGIDEIVNDNMTEYVATLNNTDDPTYYSQFA